MFIVTSSVAVGEREHDRPSISDNDSGPSHNRTFKSATKFVFRSK